MDMPLKADTASTAPKAVNTAEWRVKRIGKIATVARWIVAADNSERKKSLKD